MFIFREAAEVLQEGGAIDFGHHLVQQDDIRADIAHPVHRVAAIVRTVNIKTSAPKRLGKKLKLFLCVFDNQTFGINKPALSCLEANPLMRILNRKHSDPFAR